MTGKRKRYGAEFKARVALEALRGELTTAQLAAKHGVHQTMVGECVNRLATMTLPNFLLSALNVNSKMDFGWGQYRRRL